MKINKLIFLVLLCFSSPVFCQTVNHNPTGRQTDTLAYKLSLIYQKMHSDPALMKDSSALIFVHVNPHGVRQVGALDSFRLFYESENINWISSWDNAIQQDSLGYLLKVRVPLKVLSHASMLSCVIKWWSFGNEPLRSYGGVKTKGIKLVLESNPNKADIYLVPNRIWESEYENNDWKTSGISYKYLVDDDPTNTWVNIDETVYTVVFKLGTKYIVRMHQTQPLSVAPIQKVSVNF